MKLFHSPTSPYVRKVDVLARETGLSAKIEIVPATVSPVKRDEAVSARNPLGKVPTLLLGDGTALYDSRVICEYLDSLHDGKKYFPPSGPERWKTLTLLSLADGILDAALLARYEEFLRPPEARFAPWQEGQVTKVLAGIDELEKTWIGRLESHHDIGTVAVGCALGYIDFRFGHLGWRNKRPQLAAWFAVFAARPAMKATEPKA